MLGHLYVKYIRNTFGLERWQWLRVLPAVFWGTLLCLVASMARDSQCFWLQLQEIRCPGLWKHCIRVPIPTCRHACIVLERDTFISCWWISYFYFCLGKFLARIESSAGRQEHWVGLPSAGTLHSALSLASALDRGLSECLFLTWKTSGVLCNSQTVSDFRLNKATL